MFGAAMIKAIELKNWKTHKHTRLDFSSGTNILLGPMGAGKSTIMDAISFALFGTYPAIQHRRVIVNDIITSRPEQKNQASVKLSFSVDNDLYEVERGLELNGSTTAIISKNGAHLQSQPKRVNEEVEKILKIDYDLFSKAVYSEQNRLTYFLELRPAERKDQIDRLLGLDKFAIAQDNAGTLINKIKDMVSENEKTLATFDIKKIRGQYDLLIEEIKKLGGTREELKKAIEKQENEKKHVETQLNEAKNLYNKKTSLAREVAELKSRIKVIGEEIEKIQKGGVKDKAGVSKALAEAAVLLDRLKKEEKYAADNEGRGREILVNEEAGIRSAGRESDEKEKLQKELGKHDKKKLEETVKSGTERLKGLRGACEANIAMKNESEKWLKELEKHISKCPVCERELTKEAREKILDNRRSVVKKLEDEIKRQKQEADVLEKNVETSSGDLQKIKGIEERLIEYKDVEKRLKEAEVRVERARVESVALAKKKEVAANTTLKAREGLLKLESEKETVERLERHNLEKEKSSKALSEKEKELSKIDVNQDGIDKLQNSFTHLSSEMGELHTRLETNARDEKEKAVQAQEKRKEVELLERVRNDVERKKKAIENMTKFRNALEETQTVLRSKLIGSINEIMQDIWPELYPYNDYRGVVLEPASDDYVLKVRTGANNSWKWEDVSAIASGGEKSVACLAMRVAFALVLVPNLKWIILDEPTHNIDQQGLGKLLNVIGEVMPRIVDQVFVITHDEMLKQVANARVYQLTRNKEENGETVVEAF